jgi:hypothetical protein
MEEEMSTIELAKEVYSKTKHFIETQRDEYQKLSGREKGIRADKFPFLKITGKKLAFPRYDELFRYEELDCIKNEDLIKRYHIGKIKGIYKHAQAKKTAICNSRILLNIADGVSSLCIAKDTLTANQQWFERLLNDRDVAYPDHCPAVYVISSSSPKPIHMEKSNVKHYKNIHEFNTHIATTTCQDPYIIFVCSNNTRTINLLGILDICINQGYRPLFDLIWDEAHNPKEGIPSKRSIAERLIIHPKIRTFIPCTATIDELIEESTLFQLANLESNAIDYTAFNDFKSDSPEYSSLHKAKQIHLEDLRNDPLYQQYNVTHFDKELFKRHYNETEVRKRMEGAEEDVILEEIELDRERRRALEYHLFMIGEKKFYNDGLNLIHNIHGLFSKGIHLIHTPLRNAFTESLMVEALKQPYQPIVFGLYGSVIHVKYDKQSYTIVERGLLNEQINEALETIQKERRIGTVLLFGNYIPTGESISFYHPKYGPLASSTLLGNYTPCQANQAYSRLNYVKPNDSAEPDKFMVGEKASIENALSIEKQNDLRIDRFRSNGITSDRENVIFRRKQENTDDSNISIPIRCEYVDDTDNIIRMKGLCRQEKTSEADKAEFMELLFHEIGEKTIKINDPTGKFNNTYKMNVIRRYRKHTEEEIQARREKFQSKYKPFEEDYRFDSYSASHHEKVSYMNGKNTIAVGECEMLCCNNLYTLSKGSDTFTNSIHVFWISYRFPVPKRLE